MASLKISQVIQLISSILILLQQRSEAGLHERRLINDLFRYYDNRERPVRNESHSVQMQFGVK